MKFLVVTILIYLLFPDEGKGEQLQQREHEMIYELNEFDDIRSVIEIQSVPLRDFFNYQNQSHPCNKIKNNDKNLICVYNLSTSNLISNKRDNHYGKAS